MPVVIDIRGVYKKFRRSSNTTIKSYLLHEMWRGKRSEESVIWALKDVNLAVKKGATLGIIGQNGSGKSTLLKVIAGIIRPDAGEVSVNGKISALIELGAGFHPLFTGRENIYINGMLLGLTKKEITKKIDGIIEFAGLGDFIDQPVRTYSSGMYSKLGFSVAVNVDPDILLIDEVFAVGDEEFVHKCKAKMDEFKRRGKTILFVTHSLPTVEQWCDEAAWLEYGVMNASGEPLEISGAYKQKIYEMENSNLVKYSENTNTTLRSEKTHGLDAGRGEEKAEATAAAAARSAGPVMDNPLDGRRWGTREVEIISVKLFDKHGNERYIFDTGEDVTVRIGYKAGKTFKNLVCGIAVLRSDDVWCYGTNTMIDGIEIVELNDSGRVDFTIEDISLLGGQYFIDAAIRSRDGSTYDYHSHMHRIVIKTTEKNDIGVFRPNCRWEFSGGFSIADKSEKTPVHGETPRHVVFCLIDAAAARHMGCYGYSRNTTPNIDRLAAEGVRFENTFSQAPYTIASLCSLLSSHYPETHGAVSGNGKLSGETAMLQEVFRGNGFRTAGFSANPFFSRAFGLERGFDRFDELFMEYGVTTEHVVNIPAERLTDRAVDWLKRNHDRSCFAFIHYLQPHNPYDPPAEFVNEFDPDYEGSIEATTGVLLDIDGGKISVTERDVERIKALYDGNLAYVDREVGRLLENLKAIGIYDNALIVLLSDHGAAFGEHGRFLHNTTVYDEMIHVPLIMKFPRGSGMSNRVIRAPVELVDMAPSMVEIFNLKAEDVAFQGTSFVKALSGNPGHKEYCYSRTVGARPVYSVRSIDYKYIINSENSHEELYDLQKDRDEKRNIIKELPEKAEAFRMEFRSWMEGNLSRSGNRGGPVQLDQDIRRRLISLGYIE